MAQNSPNPTPTPLHSVSVVRVLLAASTMSVENGGHFVNRLENARDNICTNEILLRSVEPRKR